MKRVFCCFYITFVLLAITFLTFWGFYDWNQHQKQSLEKNFALFHSLADQLATVMKEPQRTTTTFSSHIKPKIISDPHWKLVIIQSTNRGVEYYFGPRLPQSWLTPDSSHFHTIIPKEESNPLTDHWIEVRLPSEKGAQDYQLRGLYTFYSSADLFEFLKLCGFVLVCLLIMTLLLIPILGQAQPSRENRAQAACEKKSSGVTSTKGDCCDSVLYSSELTRYKKRPYSTFVSALTPMQENPFLQQLELELERCARNQQDLGLVVLSNKYTGTECHYQVLNQEIEKSLLFKGPRFQYGENRFLLILPQKNLDELFKEVQDFLWRIDQYLPRTLFHAGISAQKGRPIEAAMLMNEAETALLKAFSTQQRVVVFIPS